MDHPKTKPSVGTRRSVTQIRFLTFFSILVLNAGAASPRLRVSPSPRLPVSASSLEYLWYEAENMRGLTETSQHEPQLNPSYLDLPAAKAPGWSISGPGVAAEWSQGGESEWNSVASTADETRGSLWQNVEVPRAGEY